MHNTEEDDGSSPLREAVRKCLEDIDVISAQFVDDLGAVKAYSQVVASRGEVQQLAVLSFELQLRLIGRMTIPERLSSISAEVGRLRASQGIPIAAVLQAVRTDFRILWQAILERLPPEQLADFTREAVRVWEAVEHHSMLVYDGYMQEVGRSNRELEDQRSRALGQLLAGSPDDHYLLEVAAATMGVGIDSSYLVAIAAPSSQANLRTAAERANYSGGVYVRDNFVGILLENPAHDRAPQWLQDQPCAVSPLVRGLAGLPKAWRLACDMLRATPHEPKRAVTFRDTWSDVTAWYMEPVAEAFTDLVLGGLHSIAQEDRERLLETVGAYIKCGSTSTAARHLYCHRNTVSNRIESFSRATGFNPAHPADSAAIVLAIAMRRRATG